MNINELKQVQDDLDRGVMVCSATIRRVVAHAMTQAEIHVEDEAPSTLDASWTALKQRGLRSIHNPTDYSVVHALGDELADAVGDDTGHALFPLFEIVMTLMSAWESKNVPDIDSTSPEVLPIRLDLLRHMFETHYGPKNDFAWRTQDDKYKSDALQNAWEIWQHAATAIMKHMTGVWNSDESAAKRLRAICKLVGIDNQIPTGDDDLWASSFSVLGMVRRELQVLIPKVAV